MKPFLSVIIPAYNEAKRLPLTLLAVDRYLEGVEYSSEVIVVNDGSVDATHGVATRFSHLMKNLKVIDHDINQGKGGAVRTGMHSAKGNWRLVMDADNSTALSQFEKMMPFLREGYDIVIGSRGVKGRELDPPQSLIKRIAGKLGNLVIQRMVLPGIHDTQCGFKCFSEEAADKIFKHMRITGWGWDVEALALGRRMGYRIKEIPVRWVNDPFSTVRLAGYFSTLLEVAKVRWWLTRGSYEL